MLQDDFSLSPTDVSSRTHIVKQLQFLEAEPTPNAAPHAQVMRSLVCSVVQDKVNHSLSILSKERCLGNADRSTLKSCSSSRVSRLTTSNFRDSHSSRLRALGINSSTLVKKFNTSVVDVNDQIELLKTTGETAVHALPSLKVADKRSLVWTCNYIQDQREIDFCRQNSVLEEKVNYKLQKRMGPEPKTPPMIIRHCRGAHSAPRAKVKAINLEIEEIERCTITRISTARSPKREIVSGNNNNKLGFQPLTDTSKSLKKETPEKACNPARAVCNNDKLGFQPLTDTSKPLKKKTPKLAYNPATAVWMLERHHLEINADKKLPATQNTDIALVSFSNEIKSPDVEDRKKIQLSKIDIAKAAECLTGQYIGSLIVLDSYGWENTDTIDGASQCVKDAGQNLPKIKTSSRLSQRSNHVRINSDDCSTSILTALKSAEDGKHACMKACGEGVFKPKCTSIEVEEVLHDIESPTSMMLQPHYEEFSAPFLLRKPLSFRTVVSMIQFFVELTRRITKLQR